MLIDIYSLCCLFLATSRSTVDLRAVKSAVGVSTSREEINSVLQLVRTPSIGRAVVLKLKVENPLLSKQGTNAQEFVELLA